MLKLKLHILVFGLFLAYINVFALNKQIFIDAVQPNPMQWNLMKVLKSDSNITFYGDNFIGAWDLIRPLKIKPGQGVIVAVIDTGYTPHPNFKSNLQPLNPESKPHEYKYGYQFIDDCRTAGRYPDGKPCPANTAPNLTKIDPKPDALDIGNYLTASDISGSNGFFMGCAIKNSIWHGSGMISTIADDGYIKGSPTQKLAGGAYGAKVVPIRIGGKCSRAPKFLEGLLYGLLWAVNKHPTIPNPHPAQVIHLSLDLPIDCKGWRSMNEVIDKVNKAGAVIIVASGNNSKDVSKSFPANCNKVISVSAKNSSNRLASYSSHGATTITASGGEISQNCVHYGCYMISSTWNSIQEFKLHDGHNTANTDGTSPAAAQVSAAVANIASVLKLQGEDYDYKRIVDILQKSADQFAPGGECYYDVREKIKKCVPNRVLNVGNAIEMILKKKVGYAFLGGNSPDMRYSSLVR